MRSRFALFFVANVLTMFLICAAKDATASLVLFTGIDIGVGPTGARPNSTAAEANFNAAAGKLGELNTITFEGLPTGQFTSRQVNPGVTAIQTNVDNKLGGIVKNGYATPGPAQVGFNTTAGGQQFLGFVPIFSIGTASVSLVYEQPIQAFGAFLTGLDSSVAGVLHIVFTDGTSQDVTVPEGPGGGIQFVGFTDSGKSINQIVLEERGLSGTSRDNYGLDDVHYVRTHIVPEASSLLLCTLGAVTLLLFALGNQPQFISAVDTQRDAERCDD